MGASGAIRALYTKVLMQKNFVSEFHRESASFSRKTAIKRFWVTHCEGLGERMRFILASWKARIRLPIGYTLQLHIIFCKLLRLRH